MISSSLGSRAPPPASHTQEGGLDSFRRAGRRRTSITAGSFPALHFPGHCVLVTSLSSMASTEGSFCVSPAGQPPCGGSLSAGTLILLSQRWGNHSAPVSAHSVEPKGGPKALAVSGMGQPRLALKPLPAPTCPGLCKLPTGLATLCLGWGKDLPAQVFRVTLEGRLLCPGHEGQWCVSQIDQVPSSSRG